MKKASQRDYNMTDAELCMFTSNLVGLMTRDATEFAAKGVDAAAITALEALGNAFEVFPADSFYKADVMEAVDNKDAHRDAAEVQLRAIVGCARIKWGSKSPRVKKFGAGDMTRVSDASFLTIARQGVTVADAYLTDLADVGLTQAMIDALEAEAQAFEDDLNAVATAIEQRDLKTQERVEKGNELYSYVVDYCEIGKIIWQDVDEAKYNDYVIYHEEPGVPGKVQNLTYDVPTLTASWDALAAALTYQLEYKLDDAAGVWATAYEGDLTTTVHDPGAGDWIYRVRGINENGSGEFSDELNVTVPGS